MDFNSRKLGKEMSSKNFAENNASSFTGDDGIEIINPCISHNICIEFDVRSIAVNAVIESLRLVLLVYFVYLNICLN
jgi:hypothetical protein